MGEAWEYKVITLKAEGAGIFSLSAGPNDKDATSIINREGMQGWELVSAVSTSPARPLRLFFKRPR